MRICLTVIALSALFACGRSDPNPGFTPDQKQRLDGVIALAEDVNTAIGTVDPQAPPLSDSLATLDGDIAALGARVDTVETDLADLETRITPAGEVAPLDSDVVVNDPVAIGFDPQENVTNVREAIDVVNTRLNIQSTTITNLDAAIDQRINDAIAQLIADRIAPLEANRRGVILGTSTTTTTGDAGGLAGADGICATDFNAVPSAHLCTHGEVQHALAAGEFTAADIQQVATWTVPNMTAAFVDPDHTGFHYDAAATSLTMSCNNLNHDVAPGAGATARGSSLTVDLDFGGTGQAVYVVAPNVGCDTTMPLLCCR